MNLFATWTRLTKDSHGLMDVYFYMSNIHLKFKVLSGFVIMLSPSMIKLPQAKEE